jgi:ribonuclease BN (tRNA processing enzyme)
MSADSSSDKGKQKTKDFRLTVVGSGTCVATVERGSPAILIREEDRTFLVDCGPGTMGKLAKLGVDPEKIDALFLTHLHPDHVSDLVAFLFANNCDQSARETDLSIIGAPGLREFIARLQGIFDPLLDPKSYRLRIIELVKEPIKLHRIEVQGAQVDHCESSMAYRFTNTHGKSIVVSGDTDYCRGIVDLAWNADLLVLECSFPNAFKVEGHLSPKYAGEIAREAQCRRLLLTHFYPICDIADIAGECIKEFSGEIVLAEDFKEYYLGV